jgi:hypothetical protein
METTTQTTTKRKVVVRKLEKLETTAVIIEEPGCRNDLCS